MRKVVMVLAATLGLAASAHAHPSHQHDHQRTIVVVLAHPDDELVIAPALAGEARNGSKIRLIFATSGDAGPGVSDMERGPELAAAREKEALCSAEALGIEDTQFLRFGDGTLAANPRADGSAARKLLGPLEQAIFASKPDAVITWGPEGGYGHGDHRMISALVTQILQKQPAAQRPELFFPAMIHAPLPDFLAKQGWTSTAPDLAEIHYTYGPGDLAAANAATQCHKTQFDEAILQNFAPGFHASVWKGEVAFRKAF